MWQTLVAGGILAGTVLVHASNPLATEDQHHIDELSKSFLGRGNLDALKQKAREQYVKSLKKYNVELTGSVNKDLDVAMDELVFSSIQKAANGDPANPKVYWTDTAKRTHDWFGISVPGGRYSYDNPDCIYRTIPISSKYKYKISGRRFGNGTADQSFLSLIHISEPTRPY